MIEIRVPGNPQALKRHRTFRRGKFTGTYDPSSAAKQDFLAKVMEHCPDEPLAGPLRVELDFVFLRPKSHYRTGKYADQLKDNAPEMHTSRPDCDNLAKFVLDALNGMYWTDDSVISFMTVKKRYGNPCTTVYVSDIER
jgi:Holliday junction resolvase RusA-like endonuclease